MRAQTLRELPDDAVRITEEIYAAPDMHHDWRVYEELADGRWRLIDVKRTLREVTQQYNPEVGPEFVANPPPLFHAIGIDTSGRKHDLGSGPLAALRESTMARWMADPQLRGAYVLDSRGNAYLSLEPRDRPRLMAANPITQAMQDDWDRVNYEQRLAEQSKDYQRIERAKDEVRRVYAEMQAERASDRFRRNPDTLPDPEAGWQEIGRYDTGWRAFNEMIASQASARSNAMGRIETRPSRSRPGKISYAVFLKFVDGPKQSLDFMESQYVRSHSLGRNPRRRTSRRPKGRKRTSRRVA